MLYHSYKEWKDIGYIVKKGEHATKVDDDYENTYLFSEEQVAIIISPSDNWIDNIDDKVWGRLAKENYPKIKKLLKENFNIDVEDGNGKCKSFNTVIEEIANKWNK